MLYLNDEQIEKLQPSWKEAIDLIERALGVWSSGDFSQPIKPYLRFGDPQNRIIAMPAFLGEDFHIAGIKWIASFPSNLKRNLPRAHSVTLLNDADTGEPLAIINASKISGIRTAAVSGIILRDFVESFPQDTFRIGIMGFGPIGLLHLQMVEELLGPRIDSLVVADKDPVIRRKIGLLHSNAHAVETWQEAYRESNIVITCTTSSESYISEMPKPGSLHLNVSLRDYCPEILKSCRHILVDDWSEVCRENTDIERTHQRFGLKEADTVSIKEAVAGKYFTTIDKQKFMAQEFCVFNPMGMALFDIALGRYYFNKAIEQNQGVCLTG